jgi:hypothetical protein
MYVPMKTSENRVVGTGRRHVRAEDTIRSRGMGGSLLPRRTQRRCAHVSAIKINNLQGQKCDMSAGTTKSEPCSTIERGGKKNTFFYCPYLINK